MSRIGGKPVTPAKPVASASPTEVETEEEAEVNHDNGNGDEEPQEELAPSVPTKHQAHAASLKVLTRLKGRTA
jgi:hypothetical protein